MNMKIEGERKQKYLFWRQIRMKTKIKSMVLIMLFALSPAACEADLSELQWNWVIKPGEYEDVYFIAENKVVLKNTEGKYAIADLDEEIRTEFEFDSIGKYCDEVVVVRSNGIYSILDSRGEAVIEAYFQCAYDFSEGFGAVKNEELWGFADTTGTIIIPCSYMAVRSFSEGMAAVKSDGKWGFIDKNGEMAVSGKYDDVISFREGMAAVKSGGKWGFIDYEGNSVCELIYDDVHSFQEGYAAVMANGKWGFIDKDGNICIECCYDAVGNFSEGKAAVRIDHYTSEGVDEWAYINSQEKILIDFYPYDASGDTFFQVGEFKDGMAFVSKTLLCLIDDEGNDIFDNSDFFISKPCYNKDYDVIPGYIYTDYEMTVRKYGLAAKNGVQRISPTFDYIDDMAGKYVIVGNYIEGEYCKGVIELERDNL